MPLHRSRQDRYLGGVCSGIAETIGIDAIYIRLLFLFLIIYAGSTLWVYLLLWIFLPVIDSVDGIREPKRFYRSRSDNMISGVCGGLAQAFNTDPTVIRLVFIGLAILGMASVLPYIILWLVTPLEP